MRIPRLLVPPTVVAVLALAAMHAGAQSSGAAGGRVIQNASGPLGEQVVEVKRESGA